MDYCDPTKVPPNKYTWGNMDPSLLFEKLSAEGLSPTIQHTSTGCIINIVRFHELILKLTVLIDIFLLFP